MMADVMLVAGIILAVLGLILIITTDDDKKISKYAMVAGLGLALLAGVMVHVAMWFM